MKHVHRIILRALPGPFLGWLSVIMFLLLMQFLMRYLGDIAGRGLPFTVIIELISYNLAYMLVLAVPMSVLLATLMVFGTFTESNAYTVIKGCGISITQLMWPLVIVGCLLAGTMAYFNHVVLPEANFRARVLWQDIRTQKPGFDLQPGVFYTGLRNYAILVQDRDAETGDVRDVTIYDYTEGSRNQGIIKARRGELSSQAGGAEIVFDLREGEVHRRPSARRSGLAERYERLAFERYQITFDISDFGFERSEPQERYRSERTMPTDDMVLYIDSLRQSVEQAYALLRTRALYRGLPGQPDSTLTPRPDVEDERPVPDALSADERAGGREPPVIRTSDGSLAQQGVTAGLDANQRSLIHTAAIEHARSAASFIDDTRRTTEWDELRAARYSVEVHKKYSIAVACLIFLFIGAPLGLSVGRSGLGTVGALAFGIFLFYWITLVQGEKLANRGTIDPWLGMWIANIVMIAVGLWLLVYVTLDLRATPPLRHRFLAWLRS